MPMPTYELPKPRKSKRGFASMDKDKLHAIASRGGKNVAPENRSFSKNPELAAAAGKIGGASVKPENREFSKNKELAREAGRKGGLASQTVQHHAPRGR